MEQKRMQKNSKGITLIALVITIIVLLILAGVSIATLTGDNGILNQAGKAKDKTTEAESIERVQVEVAGSYGLDGTIDKDQLNKNLKNINGLTYNGNALSDSNKIADLPAMVTLNGYRILINENGKTTKIPEGVSNLAVEIAMNPQAYYGKKVTNYKDDGNTYRIFYVDKDNYFKDEEYTIYLKADFLGGGACSTSYDTNQTLIKKMNPLWATKRGTSESSWKHNEKAAAWLCDPSKWTAYCDTDKANYAIGGPSVEMYVKSYNQAYNGIITENTKYPLGAVYRVFSYPGYIYTLNGAQPTMSSDYYGTGNDSIDYQNYESMYCGKNENGTASKTGSWWLASPSSCGSLEVCVVRGSSAGLGNQSCDLHYGEAGYGMSPLVSLKSSFIPEVEE